LKFSPRPILLSPTREKEEEEKEEEESVLCRGVSSRCGPNTRFQRGAYAVTRNGKRWIRRRRRRRRRRSDIDVSASPDVGAKRRSRVDVWKPVLPVEAPLACLRYGSRAPK